MGKSSPMESDTTESKFQTAWCERIGKWSQVKTAGSTEGSEVRALMLFLVSKML